MTKVLLAHPGTQHAPYLACQFSRLRALDRFATGLAWPASHLIVKLMPEKVRRKLSGRILDCKGMDGKVSRIATPELVALARLSLGSDPISVMHNRNRQFQETIPDSWIRSADVVIGFDTASWILSSRSEKLSRPFILDQSTNHSRHKLQVTLDLTKMFPGWAEDTHDKPLAIQRVEDEEQLRSTKIVVASTFSRNSLISQNIPPEKILINPYGVSPAFLSTEKQVNTGKFRFLFLGSVNAAKGVPFLLDTWVKHDMHKLAELHIAGPSSIGARQKIEGIEGVAYLGMIDHGSLPNILSKYDCLVFPSFFDGFGRVVLEAMASGLAVIATDASGGPDVIEHGVDGFLIKSGDSMALATHMILIAKDIRTCRHMGILARKKMKEFTWDSYGDRWKKILMSVI